MKIVHYLFAAMLAVVNTQSVFAHGGGGDQKTRTYPSKTPQLNFRTPNPSLSVINSGGVPEMAMSVTDQTIRITFKDSYGNPVNVEDAEAKAFVSSNDGTSIVQLLPSGSSTLSGNGSFTSEPDMRVDITLRLIGQKPINQTFYPLR